MFSFCQKKERRSLQILLSTFCKVSRFHFKFLNIFSFIKILLKNMKSIIIVSSLQSEILPIYKLILDSIFQIDMNSKSWCRHRIFPYWSSSSAFLLQSQKPPIFFQYEYQLCLLHKVLKHTFKKRTSALDTFIQLMVRTKKHTMYKTDFDSLHKPAKVTKEEEVRKFRA